MQIFFGNHLLFNYLYDKLYIVIIFNTKEGDKDEKTSKSI